jgi:aldose 1-epimerase
MTDTVIHLENDFWQTGVLPGTGASLAYGRVRSGGAWVDILRPTPESDYGVSSKCSSFIMLPWANRIRDGVLRFEGEAYALKTADDGTARHGDVRNRPWTVVETSGQHARLRLNSADFPDMNFPFRFSAEVEYSLDERDFVWRLALTNEDTRPMPAGFGHHPYFLRRQGVQLQIPCTYHFPLTDSMATGAPVPVPPALDFRALRPLGDVVLDDLLTGRIGSEPAHIRYDGLSIVMGAEALFAHFIAFAPAGKPFFALEPQTNANDGFNLYANGITGSGVFVLAPGETRAGTVRLGLGDV